MEIYTVNIWLLWMVLIWLMMVNIYIWLVVSTYPSEKWWSESQLGLWHSQLNGKIIQLFQTSNQILYWSILYKYLWDCRLERWLESQWITCLANGGSRVARSVKSISATTHLWVEKGHLLSNARNQAAIVMIEFILHHVNTCQYHHGQNIVSLQISALRLEAMVEPSFRNAASVVADWAEAIDGQTATQRCQHAKSCQGNTVPCVAQTVAMFWKRHGKHWKNTTYGYHWISMDD